MQISEREVLHGGLFEGLQQSSWEPEGRKPTFIMIPFWAANGVWCERWAFSSCKDEVWSRSDPKNTPLDPPSAQTLSWNCQLSNQQEFPENILVTKRPVQFSQHSGWQYTMNSHEQLNSTVNETPLQDSHARLLWWDVHRAEGQSMCTLALPSPAVWPLEMYFTSLNLIPTIKVTMPPHNCPEN